MDASGAPGERRHHSSGLMEICSNDPRERLNHYCLIDLEMPRVDDTALIRKGGATPTSHGEEQCGQQLLVLVAFAQNICNNIPNTITVRWCGRDSKPMIAVAYTCYKQCLRWVWPHLKVDTLGGHSRWIRYEDRASVQAGWTSWLGTSGHVRWRGRGAGPRRAGQGSSIWRR